MEANYRLILGRGKQGKKTAPLIAEKPAEYNILGNRKRGGKMVILDKLIYKILKVTMDEWDSFLKDLNYYETWLFCDSVKREIGKGASKYHYELRIGLGEGAIFIGFKHNMSKNIGHWDIKVELNPQKSDKHKVVIENVIQQHFKHHHKVVTLLDLAIDVEYSTKDILVLPKYAREENRYRGDRYFGNKGKHGYLKVYDKKRERKEKANVEVPQDVLTRIEYTIKFASEGVTFQLLRKLEVLTESEYTIYLINKELDNTDVLIDCAVNSILTGHKQFKDFGRYQKEKIKKALSQLDTLESGQLIKAHWDSIVDMARKFAIDYSIA